MLGLKVEAARRGLTLRDHSTDILRRFGMGRHGETRFEHSEGPSMSFQVQDTPTNRRLSDALGQELAERVAKTEEAILQNRLDSSAEKRYQNPPIEELVASRTGHSVGCPCQNCRAARTR